MTKLPRNQEAKNYKTQINYILTYHITVHSLSLQNHGRTLVKERRKNRQN